MSLPDDIEAALAAREATAKSAALNVKMLAAIRHYYGGQATLARACYLSEVAVFKWKQIPPHHVETALAVLTDLTHRNTMSDEQQRRLVKLLDRQR